MNGPRIGVFGGTFDPPHIGHLVTAVNVRHALDLDVVMLMVANDPWQKSGARAVTPALDRLAMVEAAVTGLPQVLECYAVSGSWNFLLKIISDSVESYERFLKKKLIHLPGVSSLESTIALARVKHTTRLPLAG